MTDSQHPIIESDDNTNLHATEYIQQDADSQHLSTARPVINRVCTPLGLFVERPSANSASKVLGVTMPNTITPDSQASISPPQNDTNSNTAIDQHHRPTEPEIANSFGSQTQPHSQQALPPLDSQSATESPATGTDDFDSIEAPLHTGTVRANTKIVHPKPISRSTSNATTRPSTAVSNNIAQLEATAVQLSMTSSIDDAIRDLHGELKRSDSQRSSRLAASVKDEALAQQGQLSRHMSTSSSIVSTNIAARSGGYSPAGFVMSPGNALSGRLRSSSNPSAPQDEPDIPPALSRQGPGKSSVRSVRSVKQALADISETEPIALTQNALDEADSAPPIGNQNDLQDANKIMQPDLHKSESSDAFQKMLEESFNPTTEPSYDNEATRQHDDQERHQRPSSSHSNDTFQQAQTAFADFDGAYYHHQPTDDEDELEEDDKFPEEFPEEEQQEKHMHSETLDALEAAQAIPPPQTRRVRPQSYMDPETGVQMLYYPARVPAMLNLPPKLSSRPKAAVRNSRQSKVLSAMWDNNAATEASRRHSAMPNLNGPAKPVRQSWLPELSPETRHSFMPLSGDASSPELHQTPVIEQDVEFAGHSEQEVSPRPETLRVPQRLSRFELKNKAGRASQMSMLPSQLRASAYFDLPSTTPDVEVKDGSAMATLDSILDASAGAPVSAFTDHLYAGKLGTEVYGKEKKRRSVAASTILSPPADETDKRRSSFMWSAKRKSTVVDEDRISGPPRTPETKSLLDPSPEDDEEDDDKIIERDDRGGRIGRLRDEDEFSDEDGVIRVGPGTLHHQGEGQGENDESQGEEEEEEVEEYFGAPTTLLAELQLRKQQQQDRTKHRLSQAPLGTRATLLEMDAIAENQKQDRMAKRVNLAWEDEDAHYDQNGSDDEDVPLAIIAAKHAGAKNMADVERPIGLMEKREMDDNEPLSQRRDRLQGRDAALAVPRPQTMMSDGPSRLGDTRLPHSVMPPTPEPVEEIEGETLAARRRRLAGRDGSEVSLPKTRPVSRAFSEELLSQFGDLEKDEQPEGGKEADARNAGDETLGQRRRRLQAERAAREEEMMNYGNMPQDRRMGMADVLGAHARKSPDLRAQEARLRREQQERAEAEKEVKMAAMRMQMPTSLATPFTGRAGPFAGGMYNNGAGGLLQQQNRPFSSTMPQQQMQYGHMGQQPMYNHMNGSMPGMNGYGGMNMNMNMYNNNANPAAMNVYGKGAMQMPVPAGSMDRVELWRQDVRP